MRKPKNIKKSIMGAQVLYCGHKGSFAADIHVANGVAVVVGPEPRDRRFTDLLDRYSPSSVATHHLMDFPKPIYWNETRGVFVVPVEQIREL